MTTHGKERLLALYEMFPFLQHPFWRGVMDGSLTREQVLLGEIQHFLRTREGRKLRERAVQESSGTTPRIFEAALRTYLEECTHDASGPSHLDLVERLLLEGGITEERLRTAVPTVGNAAAMALYKDIARRGPACHLLGAGAVEHYYSRLAPLVYRAYTERYGFSQEAAETYHVHATIDQTHAERAFGILDEAVGMLGWDVIEHSVRDAFCATSLHYDGMYQAATNRVSYWSGGAPEPV